MASKEYSKVLKNFPVAFACLKIIYSSSGKPCDFEFIEANSAFTKLTGLKIEDIISNKISGLPEQIRNSQPVLMRQYLDFASDGKSRQFKYFSEPLNRWYNASLFTPEKSSLITIISDLESGKGSPVDAELFFNLNPDILFISDSDFNFLRINKTFEDTLGYQPKKAAGKKFTDFVHPEDLKKTIEAISKLRHQPQVLNLVNRYARKDGSYIYLEWSLSTRDKIVFGIARDITDKIIYQERMKENEENFFRFFNTIDDMIFIGNLQGRILFTNKAVAAKLSYSYKESLEMNILDFHPEEYRKEAAKIFADMIAGNTSFCQIPLADRNREKIPVETRIWHGKWNEIDCIYGISKDLSGQQAALDKFNKVFSSNPAPMALSSVIDGRFVEVNEAFLKKLQFRRKEVIGKTSAELDLFHQPDKHSEVRSNLDKEKKIKDVELVVNTKKGEKIRGIFSGEIIDNQFEKYYLTVMADITSIKNAQEALKKQALLLKLILEISAGFVNATAVNLNQKIDNMLKICGKFFEVDRSYLFLIKDSLSSNTNEWCDAGIKPEKDNLQDIPVDSLPWWMGKLSRHDYIYIPDVSLLPQEAAREKGLLEEQSIKSLIAIPVVCKKELIGFFGFDSVAEKKTWSKDQISQLIILANILSDAIVKCRMEDEVINAKNAAEAANHAKSQFLANMSHEIRTPINGINGYLELLKNSRLSDEQKKYIDKMSISQKTLLALIEDILDISRIEAGKLVLQEEPVNIALLAESIISQHYDQFKSKNLSLRLNIDPGVPELLLGDNERIKQVLSNLLTNSLKFTDRGYAEVRIKSRKKSSNKFELEFLVEDTGKGMSKDVLRKILKPFEQEDTRFNKEMRGYGLGIPICKSIIEAMSGKLVIESRKNKGTRVKFNIILNAADRDRDKVKENARLNYENSSETGYSFNKDLKILLAEDNDINSSLFIEIMKKLGLGCDLAKDGRKAVNMCKKNKYDIIFMDCQMPVLDGVSAARKIREGDGSSKTTAIIALTAFVMDKDIKACMESGMDDYITKPINIERLKEIIRKYSPGTIKPAKAIRKISPFEKSLKNLMKETGIGEETSRDLLNSFIKKAGNLVKKANSSISQNKIKEAGFILHQLKGSSANVRAGEIHRHTGIAETALKDGDLKKASLHVQAVLGLIRDFYI